MSQHNANPFTQAEDLTEANPQPEPIDSPPAADLSGDRDDSAGSPPVASEAEVEPDSSADSSDGGLAEMPTHTIKAGDTLTRIAALYDVSIDALLNANDLPNPDFLEVGQVINLPQAPVDFTLALQIIPDSRLVRSMSAAGFHTEEFTQSQAGILRQMMVVVPTRLADGSQRSDHLNGSQIVERISSEYSVDARLLLAFLEHYAALLTEPAADSDKQLYPLLSAETSQPVNREGLYMQISWLADQLNKGYYDWKYRGKTILERPDGSRLYYHPSLNAATVAIQYVVAQLVDEDQWEADIGEAGLYETYRRLFGDPFAGAQETTPSDLRQPELTLPFPRGDAWRFTGGFHGGWGNGSAWSAVDFAPPDDEPSGWCYTSSFPVTAIARGMIVALGDGLIVLDLDGDGNAGSGWTIVYLHVNPHDALRIGQTVSVGNILGYASCSGGFSTATHLHIARRYNGEWIPADCNRCPAGVSVPPFVMSNWRVVGLGSQLYQGFLVNVLDNRSVIAEQGRFTDVNLISW
ncbi:MAG: LysM peptidoglycan-binding domain-containing protein [Chloroflexi bacterium]|nr:LysM peptidoglycan-binding domain-containing protein [Chloroflexota bacterium]